MEQNVKHTREKTYKKQAALSGFHFITEVINLVMVIFTLVKSRSLIIWLDLINSLGNTLRVGLMCLFSRKMMKSRKQTSHYDTEKAEAMVAFLCNCLVFIGLIVTLILSLIKFRHPTDPGMSLLWAIVFKFFCTLFDLPILIVQYRIKKKCNNQVTKSGFIGALTAFLFDAVAFLSVCIVFFTREMPGSEYVSPALSLLIAVVLMVFCVREIVKSIHTLTNKALSEEEQKRIISIISEGYDDYKYFDNVRIHYNEAAIRVDVTISIDEELFYSDIKKIRREVQQRLDDNIDDCVVTMLIK